MLRQVITTLALGISVLLCLPLLLSMCALLTIGSGPIRTQVPVPLHTPLLVSMLGGPVLAAVISGSVWLWHARTSHRVLPEHQLQQAVPLHGSQGMYGFSLVAAVVILGTGTLLLLGLFVHFLAG
jgi:hypothetical protein